MSVEEKLKLYQKALCLFVNWAEECGFGYDNLDDLSEKYREELEKKELGYIEGLMYIALKEAGKENSELYDKWIKNTEEVATEATKELQEENRQLKNDYEMIHNCFLISENEKKNLEKQNTNFQIMLQAEREVRCNEEYLKRVTELEHQVEQAIDIISGYLRFTDAIQVSYDPLRVKAERFVKEN